MRKIHIFSCCILNKTAVKTKLLSRKRILCSISEHVADNLNRQLNGLVIAKNVIRTFTKFQFLKSM